MTRISVAIPVLNGAAYLAEAVRSVTTQSFGDLEIVIVDNCSTDATSDIARDLAAADPRIRYVRNDSTIPMHANFLKAFHEATGEAFMWLAHDDWLGSVDYLKTLHAPIVDGYEFAFPNANIVTCRGDEIVGIQRDTLSHRHRIDASPVQNHVDFIKFYCSAYNGIHFYGLFRRSSLARFVDTFGDDCQASLIFPEGVFLNRAFGRLRSRFCPEVAINYRIHGGNISAGGGGGDSILASYRQFIAGSIAAIRTSPNSTTDISRLESVLRRRAGLKLARLYVGRAIRRFRKRTVQAGGGPGSSGGKDMPAGKE